MIRCSACRTGTLEVGKTKRHDVGALFGLSHVYLEGAPALVCPNCGHVALEGEVIELTRRALARLIVTESGLLTSSEARFLRETMGMTQAELGQRLHVIRGTITRWESGEKLGALQSFALRTLAAWSLNDEKLAYSVSAPEAPPPKTKGKKSYRIDQRALA